MVVLKKKGKQKKNVGKSVWDNDSGSDNGKRFLGLVKPVCVIFGNSVQLCYLCLCNSV